MHLLRFAVLAGLLGTPSAWPAQAQSDAATAGMRIALQQVREDDWRAADSAAVPAGAVGRDIVEWYRLRAGEGTFAEIMAFLERRPDWPARAELIRAAETSMVPETPPEEVVAFYGGRLPETTLGLRRLIDAHAALGQRGDAEALAVLGWRSMALGPETEAHLLSLYEEVLAPHHTERLDEMLWQGRETAARRMYGRVPEGWQALAEARLALAARAPGVDARIEAVPEALADHGGLAHARFDWRVYKGRRDDAMALMIERSESPEALGRPEKWANWRRIYARMRMRAGDPEMAYALASRHFLVEGSHFADLEWLSGYLALRYLGDPDLALFHFDRFETAVVTPISLGRAGYWRGRAYAELGDTESAMAAYREGARWQTSFYGLLAAEAAGIPLDPALTGRDPEADPSVIAENPAFQAARLFLAAGEPWRAEQFLTHLAGTLSAPEAASLGAALLEMGETHIALRVAKATARNGIVLPAAYFPLSPLMERDLPVETALALAVARRESEFDPVVVSPAGARGIMQLMPGTARDVSAELGLPYDRDGLTSDPEYNIALGSAYLAGLIEAFGPAPILVSVGYNAGPGRAVDWVAEYGDPRRENVDLIDWIELIPFRETRNYVMRVTESVIVYRARLTGETGPVRMLDYLRNG